MEVKPMFSRVKYLILIAIVELTMLSGCRSANQTVQSYPMPGQPQVSGTADYSAMNTAPPATDTWTCPMHAQIKSSGPGKCPICGMELVKYSVVPADAGTASQSSGSATNPSENTNSPGTDHSHSSGSGCSH